MARDVALISTWNVPVRGREAKSLEVFMELLAFWGQKASDGQCEQPEAYFSADGSNGVFIVKGKSDVLREIEESDEARKLLAKGKYDRRGPHEPLVLRRGRGDPARDPDLRPGRQRTGLHVA